MTSLAELAREHSKLEREDIDHLHRLTAEWAFLADLCFADLLLYVRSDAGKWLTVDQVRPATNQTIYVTDYVGSWAGGDEAALIEQAAEGGQRVEGAIELDGGNDGVNHGRMLAIPVRHNDRVIAVLSKEWKVRAGRPLGELERNYSYIFEEFVQMIEAGSFPFAGRVADSSAAPRVGDGVLTLDSSGTVTYVSPNANSALHRVGIQANPVGMRLAELGFHDGPVRQAFERFEPVVEEFEQGADVTLLCRCVPIVTKSGANQHIAGGLLLVRDVTELRKRDRLLLSKDATIREIHHRVKNNLQTISSLLRLQARRMESEEGKFALLESVRRIGAIAIVHETLANDASEDATGDDAPFEDVARPLIRMIEEGLQSPEKPIRFELVGEAGRLPLVRSMPLAVVLTELLQNVVDHAFPLDSEQEGERIVTVGFKSDGNDLMVSVSDNGQGPPEGFDFAEARGLGLTLVNTFVTTELGGTITMTAGDGPEGSPGTSTTLRFPRTWEDRVSGPAIDG